jgi:hypothetical protein
VVLKKWRDGVAMPVIPDSLEVECERILVWGYPGQKVSETSFQPTSQAWWHISVIPVVWEE